MDRSYDASKSEGSSEEEWMDLSKSDYAKVIFSNLYWNSGSGDVGCYFALTETVSKNPSDYIGIFKVGYDNLSQCLAIKKLSELKCEDESKPVHCDFKSEELPELNGFYQFLYVTHEKEVCGASMPFEVKLAQKKDTSLEEVVTERIENDFLMVRYGLEQRNYKLETLLKTYEAENVVLVQRIKELKGEKAALTQKFEKAEQDLSTLAEQSKLFEKDVGVLFCELESVKAEKAAILDKLHDAEKRNDIISNELEKAMKEAADFLFFKEEIEHFRASNRTIADDFDKKLEEKNALIAESNKIIEELFEKAQHQENFIKKLRQENQAGNLNLEEYKKDIGKLNLTIEELQVYIMSKEKLLKNRWNGEREQKYNLMEIDLQSALHQKNVLEKEVVLLKRYLENPQEYTRPSHQTFEQVTVDERLVVEQLEDAKFMIKALEDSKQLAMKEMHELSEKLKKTKEELNQFKCENMALKIFLEEKTDCGPSENIKNHSDKKIQAETDNVKMNLLSKLKETDPTVDMDNLERKLMDLIVNAQNHAEEINKGKVELSLLKCENMALKIFLEENASCGSSKKSTQDKTTDDEESGKQLDKEIQVEDNNVLMNILSKLKETDPTVNMYTAEEKLGDLVINVQHQAEKIDKLKEECKRKEEEINSLKTKLDIIHDTTVNALMNVEDKTARIVQAAELYKDLYKEKEKLAKQLRKLTLMKSRSKKSSISKAQDISKPSFLPLNIEKSPACSESTSNNSDSDTGEHVRAQILYPDLKKDENYMSASLLPQASVIDETEVKPSFESTSLDDALQKLCSADKDVQVYKASSKANSLSLQPLSVEQDTHIPCLICGKSFLVTPHSNIPMIEHLEKEHNMDICPLCGQMFDKSFPSKYLMFHINDHFQSE